MLRASEHKRLAQMPLQLDHARTTAIDRSVVARRHYDGMLPAAVHLPPRSRFRLALDLIVGVPILGALWLLNLRRTGQLRSVSHKARAETQLSQPSKGSPCPRSVSS